MTLAWGLSGIHEARLTLDNQQKLSIKSLDVQPRKGLFSFSCLDQAVRSTTFASGAFFFTEAIPPSMAEVDE